MFRRRLGLILTPLLILLPTVASAHAFGQNYTLPLPAWLYIYGGGAVVLVSFVLIGLLAGSPAEQQAGYPRLNITKFWLTKWLNSAVARNLIKVLSILAVAILVTVGFLRTQYQTESLDVIFFWIVFLLGFTYLTAIFGNFWPAINPWRILLGRGFQKPRFGYPQWLGYWPALAIYFYLIWLELLSGGQGVNAGFLTELFIIYSLINVVGAYLFSQDVWFHYGEFFSVFFRLVSQVSLFEKKNNRVYLRPPVVGILGEAPDHPSVLPFVIFMLASTAYDGFRGTVVWQSSFIWVLNHLANTLLAFDVVQVVSLLLAPAVLILVYYLAIAIMKWLTQSRLSVQDLALKFTYTLIPIAVAYNAAHYFSLLVVQGQTIIPVLSDPFRLGWNLFHTAHYTINIGIIPVSTIWDLEVAFIVLGHIAAVYVSHLLGLRLFPNSRRAIISQLSLLVVMVAYTMLGLWILSQPFGSVG